MIHTLVRGRTHWTSRRTAIAVLGAVAGFALGAALGGCSRAGGGPPPGFGPGAQWAIPILGALGDSTPLTAVTIDGKGPYLFAVDVNAPSAVDPRLARELGLGPPPAAQGEQATPAAAAATPRVTIPRITLGNLTVAPARFEVRDVRATHHGRPVQGSIGREILHPTLLWTLDRDRQSLYLGMRERQAPPPGAQRVAVRSAGGGAALLVEAQVAEGITAMLRVTFDSVSAIRPELAEKAGMQAIGRREWMADEVRVGEASASEILFSAFGKVAPAPEPAQPASPPPGMPEAAVTGGKRPPAPTPSATPAAGQAAAEEIDGVDGVLGQRFWASFLVAMYLAESAMWLAPRAEEPGALTAERLSRWGALFDGCQSPACVSLAVAEPAAAVPAPADQAAGKPDDQASKPDDKSGKAGPGKAGAGKPGGGKPGPGAAGGKNPGKAGKGPKAAEAAPEPPPSNRLVVTREASKKDEVYDVLLQAFDEVDAPLPAPYVLVALPKGVTEVAFELTAIAPAYERAASFRVVDATPFPPPCRDKQGCFWLQR
jgi:hypothetical protein